MRTRDVKRKNRPKKAALRGRRRKEGRPQEILEAAFEEFAANGFAATRLEDVARRGGIAKGTIYLYFRDKAGLFRAVVRNMIQPVFENLAPFVERFPGSSKDLLRNLIARQYAHVVGNEKARAILRLLIAESGNFPRLSEIFHREIIGPGVSVLRQVLSRGEASGEFRRSKVRDFPQIMIAPGVLAILWRLVHGDRNRLNLRAYMSAHTEFVLRALQEHRGEHP